MYIVRKHVDVHRMYTLFSLWMHIFCLRVSDFPCYRECQLWWAAAFRWPNQILFLQWNDLLSKLIHRTVTTSKTFLVSLLNSLVSLLKSLEQRELYLLALARLIKGTPIDLTLACHLLHLGFQSKTEESWVLRNGLQLLSGTRRFQLPRHGLTESLGLKLKTWEWLQSHRDAEMAKAVGCSR